MRIPAWRTALALLLPAAVAAQSLPIDNSVLAAVAQETSGESAKRNLDRITLYRIQDSHQTASRAHLERI